MFEVEGQFAYDKEAVQRIKEDAVFIKEVTNHDIYYDTKDYTLSRKDNWLRKRNGNFELKISEMHGQAHGDRTCSKYKEINTDADVCNWLSIPVQKLTDDVIAKHGYVPFADYTVVRQKYSLDNLNIDIDTTHYNEDPGNPFVMFEVEVVVNSQDEIMQAEKMLQEFKRKYSLKNDLIKGKAITYLEKYRPEQFQVMVKHNVIRI